MKNQKGFTLIEIIMVICILGIVSVISFAFVGRAAGTYQLASGEGKTNAELWVAMERLTREVQYLDASSACLTNCVTAPASAAMGTPTTGSTLTFNDAKKATCLNCADTATANISYTYDAATKQLRRSGTLANVIVADNVTAFTVTRTALNAAATVQYLTVTITKTESTGTYPITLTQSILPNSVLTYTVN